MFSKYWCHIFKGVTALLFTYLLMINVNANADEGFELDADKLSLMKHKTISNSPLDVFTEYKSQRPAYINALNAYKQGDYNETKRILETELVNYPLAINISYLLLRTSDDSFEDIPRFIQDNRSTKLTNSLQSFYFYKYGGNKNYSKMYKVLPTEPQTQNGKCLWYRGKYDSNDPLKQQAISYVKNLYTGGYVLAEYCKSFVTELKRKNVITFKDDLTRLRSSFVASDRANVYKQTIKELRQDRSKTKKEKNLIELYDKVYSKPETYDKLVPKQKTSLAVVAFSKYAKSNPKDAINRLSSFQKKYKVSVSDMNSIKVQIMQNLFYKYGRDDIPLEFIDKNLAKLGTPKLLEQRFRIAVWRKDNATILKVINMMSSSNQESDNIKYWKARALDETGKTKEARKLFAELAKERSFYGFMAAMRINVPFAINETKVSYPTKSELSVLYKKYRSFVKFVEYHYLGDIEGVKSSFYEMMKQTNLEDSRKLALLVSSIGYPELALWQTIQKKDWNVLQIRMPIVYKDIYAKNSREADVSISYLYGITRQESMMNPKARSPVGARGLMQLMPKTAELVNKELRLADFRTLDDLYKPNVNVALGSNYLKNLLLEFNNNRIYSTASYNAGPHRAKAWQSTNNNKRDFITYIESIPYAETRKYVQMVLFYTYIYQLLINDSETTPIFITEEEMNALY